MYRGPVLKVDHLYRCLTAPVEARSQRFVGKHFSFPWYSIFGIFILLRLNCPTTMLLSTTSFTPPTTPATPLPPNGETRRS